MNVSGVIQHVSGQMNDQQRGREYRRWTRTVLLEYLNQARAEIAAYRPEALTKTIPLTLVPGAAQTAPDGVSSVTRLVSNSDGSAIRDSDPELYEAFAAYEACPPKLRYDNGSPQFSIRSSSVDAKNPKVFFVSPPVPDGLTVTVMAEVVGQAVEYTLADWDADLDVDSKFYNNLIDFMMARAFQLNTESQVSQSKAEQLFSRFYEVMGVKYKMHSAFKSGYYSGQLGTGDPRARA